MNRVLILFTHPRYEKSRVNRALLESVGQLPGVTLNDLYERYPDFNIDVAQEQALLASHEVIIWHHPFYMYGAPALLKQWIDLVLEYGWAHGKRGDFLQDKIIFNALTAAGTRKGYATDGYNRFTIREFLAPFDQTAALCKMIYLPPFVVPGTHLLTTEELSKHAARYRTLLVRLVQGNFDLEGIKTFAFLNDWLMDETGS